LLNARNQILRGVLLKIFSPAWFPTPLFPCFGGTGYGYVSVVACGMSLSSCPVIFLRWGRLFASVEEDEISSIDRHCFTLFFQECANRKFPSLRMRARLFTEMSEWTSPYDSEIKSRYIGNAIFIH